MIGSSPARTQTVDPDQATKPGTLPELFPGVFLGQESGIVRRADQARNGVITHYPSSSCIRSARLQRGSQRKYTEPDIAFCVHLHLLKMDAVYWGVRRIPADEPGSSSLEATLLTSPHWTVQVRQEPVEMALIPLDGARSPMPDAPVDVLPDDGGEGGRGVHNSNDSAIAFPRQAENNCWPIRNCVADDLSIR
jgi:hypothetical protein